MVLGASGFNAVCSCVPKDDASRDSCSAVQLAGASLPYSLAAAVVWCVVICWLQGGVTHFDHLQWMQFCSFGNCALGQPADVSFLLITVLLLLLLCGVVCGVVICWLQGGATHFDHLGISVQPQQGMALLFFPSYANGTADPR
jgi:hypothetical protein